MLAGVKMAQEGACVRQLCFSHVGPEIGLLDPIAKAFSRVRIAAHRCSLVRYLDGIPRERFERNFGGESGKAGVHDDAVNSVKH